MSRSHATLGPLFWITLGQRTWILVCNGAPALEVLQSPSFSSAHLQKGAGAVAGRSLLAQDGDVHRRMRGAMHRPLLPRGLAAGGVPTMMASALGELTSRWSRRGSARVLPDVQEVALAVIFRALGVGDADLPAFRAQYRELLLSNLGIDLDLPGSPLRRAARARVWIDGQLAALVRRTRQRPDEETLLGALARGTDERGNGLADDELVDNLRLLVLAGHETISATLAWIVIALGSRPDLWRALRDEVSPNAELPTSIEEARRFPLAEALFRETVRLHPPFGIITRRTTEDVIIHGRSVPARTTVGVNIWGLGRDPSLFDRPDDLLPARWLGRSGPPSAIELSQFGAGAHFCMGYHLAWLEAVQFTVALARSMGGAGLAPTVAARLPRPMFVPTEHPSPEIVVRFVADRRHAGG